MALLPILEFPDPRLRTRARPVAVFDKALKQLAADMLDTMYAAPGIGLAATQVDQHIQLIVIDISDTHDLPLVLVNPRVLSHVGLQVYQEGCLSVPGIYADVGRAEQVRVAAQNLDGALIEFDADGLRAVCIQHEMDHLLGKVFVDYLSPFKREQVRKRLEKARRDHTSETPAREHTL